MNINNKGTNIFDYIDLLYHYRQPVERGLRIWDIGSLVPGRVKPMT